MPCNSDHMNARPNEVLSRETAKLIVYLNTKLASSTPAWIVTASEEYYGAENRVDEIVAILCTTIRGLSDEQRDAIVYNGKDETARKLADWWDEHQKADAIREAAEAQAEADRKQAAALLDAVEKLKSYAFKPGIESTLFRLKGSEVAALLAAAAKVAS